MACASLGLWWNSGSIGRCKRFGTCLPLTAAHCNCTITLMMQILDAGRTKLACSTVQTLSTARAAA